MTKQLKPYAVITQPDSNLGRQGWETYDGYEYAKHIAAFYRYTYAYTVEIWTLAGPDKLGRCLKRETPSMGTRYDWK